MEVPSLLRRTLGKKPRRRVIAVVAAAMLAAGGGGLAWASIPDGGGVLHACLGKSGLVRIIDTATQTCDAAETPISWSQQGPAGPQGPIGPPGAAGPAGLPGAGTIVATGGAAGPISGPGARVVQPGGNNDAYPVLTVPFTLTSAGFVHAMAYGEVALSADTTCDGNTFVMGDTLFFAIDGKITGQGITGAATSTPNESGSAGADAWLSAGTHTLDVLYGPMGCNKTATGTITITNLHVEAVSY